MSHSPEAVKQHIKVYITIFVALAVLTVVTVGVSYFHLPLFWAVFVALAIATFKGSLVATFFMHLSTEKKIIFAILALTVFFFFALMLLPAITTHTQNQI